VVIAHIGMIITLIDRCHHPVLRLDERRLMGELRLLSIFTNNSALSILRLVARAQRLCTLASMYLLLIGSYLSPVPSNVGLLVLRRRNLVHEGLCTWLRQLFDQLFAVAR